MLGGMRARVPHGLVVVGLAAVLAVMPAGCGGGGDSGPDQTTLTFAPSTALTVYSTGGTNGAFGLHVGQQANVSSKGGIRFPLFPFVDANDVIVSARLRVKQAAPTSTIRAGARPDQSASATILGSEGAPARLLP